MKKIILLSALLLAVGSAGAKERTQAELKGIAARALKQHVAVQSPMRKVKAEEVQLSLRELVATDELKMFAAEGVGTVIVSRDDMFEEVLGVSESEVTSDNLPDNFRWWLETTSQTLQRRRAQGYPAMLTRAAGTVQPVNISNFVKTKWGQGEPFCSLCPDVSGQRCVTGCVATAMAQIFHYYKYPAQLDGSTGFSYTVNGATKRSRLWASVPYDWSNMSNNYKNNYTAAQSKAVAELMRDCGYSVHMRYALGASGASADDIPSAAARNFGYDSLQVAFLSRHLFTEAEWQDMVYSELASRNPILYGGATADGSGHAFVFSGMRTNGQVYVNWGWGGDMDGFFSIDYLDPYSDGVSNFAAQTVHMVLGFRPQLAQKGEMRGRLARSLFFLQSPSAQADADRHLQVSFASITNYGWLYFCGQVYCRMEKVGNPQEALVEYISEEGDVSPMFEGYDARTIDFTLLARAASLSAGRYRLTLYSFAENETMPRPLRTVGGIWMQEVEIDGNGLVVSLNTVTPEKASVATSIEAHEAARQDATATYNLSGQRVNAATRGIVIRDGKKFVNK